MKIYHFIIMSLLLLSGCAGGEKKTVMSPEETVEAFCRTVAVGDMERACELCDTEAMKAYLENWNSTWKQLEKKDSSALRIAAGILSEAEFSVDRSEKDGDRRTVTYTLKTEGQSKSRKAILKKEEGEWKVEGLTDVQ